MVERAERADPTAEDATEDEREREEPDAPQEARGRPCASRAPSSWRRTDRRAGTPRPEAAGAPLDPRSRRTSRGTPVWKRKYMKSAKKPTCDTRRTHLSTRMPLRAGIPEPGSFGIEDLERGRDEVWPVRGRGCGAFVFRSGRFSPPERAHFARRARPATSSGGLPPCPPHVRDPLGIGLGPRCAGSARRLSDIRPPSSGGSPSTCSRCRARAPS